MIIGGSLRTAASIVRLINATSMETKTEVGKILQALNYRDSQVARFDELALHLYSIPIEERCELISALMWYCNVMTKDGNVHPCCKKHIDRYDAILAKANEWHVVTGGYTLPVTFPVSPAQYNPKVLIQIKNGAGRRKTYN